MVKTFTSKDVLRYFYGEISKNEKNEIEEAIAFDADLQDIYVELENNQALLKVTIKPNNRSIDNILNYSKSFASMH